MANDERSVDLVERWRQGDEEAANLLFGRYVERMMRVVGGHLPASLGARVDPEDIVQSVFRTAFRRLQHGEFHFRDDGDIWKLLVTIALNKTRRQKARNQAARRDVHREARLGESTIDETLSSGLQSAPTISEVVAFRETLNRVFRELAPEEAQVVQLRLEGYNQDEIADQLQVTTRTIRRRMTSIRQSIAQLLQHDLSLPPDAE